MQALTSSRTCLAWKSHLDQLTLAGLQIRTQSGNVFHQSSSLTATNGKSSYRRFTTALTKQRDLISNKWKRSWVTTSRSGRSKMENILQSFLVTIEVPLYSWMLRINSRWLSQAVRYSLRVNADSKRLIRLSTACLTFQTRTSLHCRWRNVSLGFRALIGTLKWKANSIRPLHALKMKTTLLLKTRNSSTATYRSHKITYAATLSKADPQSSEHLKIVKSTQKRANQQVWLPNNTLRH